jgi:Flp pilus assembly protein TadG
MTRLPKRACRGAFLRLPFARFAKDRRGNVAAIFALALIPVVGFIGAAVDYSRAGAVKTSMQSALDAAALMVAREAPGLTTMQIAQKTNDYFKANFNHPEAQGLVVTSTYDESASQLVIKGQAAVPMSFMNVVGVSHIDVAASSIVKWRHARASGKTVAKAPSRLRIAN